jgi:heme/copper-type cytochrome/quinol oxidase subunit 2
MTIRSVLFWVAAGCCVLAELAILRSLLFGSARDAERQPVTGPLASARRATRPVEIAWAVLPAIGLALVLYLTWRQLELGSESIRTIQTQVESDRPPERGRAIIGA